MDFFSILLTLIAVPIAATFTFAPLWKERSYRNARKRRLVVRW